MRRLVFVVIGFAVIALLASCGGSKRTPPGVGPAPPPPPPATHDVSGTIADPYGNPIADASILINGEDAGLSTDAVGEFTIPQELVPATGPMRLGFRHQGILLGEREVDPAESNVALRFGDPDAEGGVVNGLILDAENNEPLCDALVVLFKGVSEDADGWAAFDVTGEDGTFSFSQVPAGRYQLLAYHLGYRLEMVSLAVEAGKTTQQLVYLNLLTPTPPPEGYTVRGYIRDADTGAGIPDAVVTGDSSGGWYYVMEEVPRAQGEANGRSGAPEVMPPYPPDTEPPVHQTTTTDGEGYFEFPDPFNGMGVYLGASAEGYLNSGAYYEKESDRVIDAEIALEPIIPVHVAGNVHDPDGNGIEGAYVEFVYVGEEPWLDDRGLIMPLAGGMEDTDANELAEQAYAPPPSEGEGGGEGYDQSPDNLAMQRLRYRNRPGHGASSLPEPPEPFGYYSATTDENGDFDFGEIPAGFYSVFASAYGYLGYWDMREVTEDDPNAQIELEPVPVGTVRGTVKDESGNAIEDALVNATQPYVDPFTFTDANGEFVLDNVPVGTWRVGAYKEGFEAAAVTVEIVENVELTLDFTLYERQAPPPTDLYTFTGRVLDGVTGEPVSDAELAAVATDDSYWAHDFSGSDGYFQLLLPAGSYNIDIEHEGYQSLYTNFWVGDRSGPGPEPIPPIWSADGEEGGNAVYGMDFYLWPIGSGPMWGGGNRGWMEDGTDVPPPSVPGEPPEGM